MNQIVATFYKFIDLPDCEGKQKELLDICQQSHVKGTILLAKEGINGTIAGDRSGIDTVLEALRSDVRLQDLEVKESVAASPPFERLKVRIKQEIVTFGQPTVNPNEKVGNYVPPQQWNELLEDPEVVVIDTRNDYEVAIGSFKGAKNPHTQSFREFPDYVQQQLDPGQHTKVAMFCTGGIRCEKASSYLLSQGFKEVYHLKGGILKYLEEISAEESLWEGECFVFDERVAVKQGLSEGSYELCLGCGYPLSAQDKASPHYEEGICCPHCYQQLTPEKRQRQTEKWKQLKIMNYEL
ncbi:MAG: rhodanese-related sulfurtransferase [Microcystaceae cyanobacterium]